MKIKYSRALALVAGAALLPCLSVQAGPEDSRIEQSAKDSYAFKTYLSNDHIHVKSHDGVVTLTGSVADESQKDLAANTVSSLPGVVNVNNELRVKGAGSEHSDTWLAVKVKSALLFHRNVSATDTKIAAQNGVVTLTGTAKSEAQKELTGEYAKDVDGVVSVNNMLTVNGGAPVVESAGAQNNAPVVEGNRSGETFHEKIDDASITAQVKGALLSHRSTSALDTKVKTTDGNVVVSGVARDSAEKELVTKLVSDINGVRNVDNEMTVASH